MGMRDQQRAALAYEHVSAYQQNSESKAYAAVVHKTPALIHTAGLCQALHFLKSRKDTHHSRYLDHLAAQLSRCLEEATDQDGLLKIVREAPLGRYMRLTEEALACAAWYRRLAQGLLKDGDTQG